MGAVEHVVQAKGIGMHKGLTYRCNIGPFGGLLESPFPKDLQNIVAANLAKSRTKKRKDKNGGQ